MFVGFLEALQVFAGGKHVRGYMHVFSRRMSSFGRVWCLEAIMSFLHVAVVPYFHSLLRHDKLLFCYSNSFF